MNPVALTRKKAIFIHSEVDELGLRPMEFRIYAHLTRRADERGKAWPGMRSIAKVCGCDRNSVATAIEGLKAGGLLQIEKGARNANIYVLTEPAEWRKNSASRAGESLNHSATTGGNIQTVTGGNFQPQGNPREVYPMKGIQESALFEEKITKRGKTRAVPTVEEIQEHFGSLGWNEAIAARQAQKFFDYYESKGWLVGKARMTNWRAAARGWKNREQDSSASRMSPAAQEQQKPRLMLSAEQQRTARRMRDSDQ